MLILVTANASQPLNIADHLGPVSYVAVEFPEGGPPPDGFKKLFDLQDSGVILVMDLEFVTRSQDGSLTTVLAETLDFAGLDGAVLENSNSGLLDREDLERVGAQLDEGVLLAVVVYENLAFEPVLQAWSDGGSRLVAEGPVDVSDLEHALELEQRPPSD